MNHIQDTTANLAAAITAALTDGGYTCNPIDFSKFTGTGYLVGMKRLGRTVPLSETSKNDLLRDALTNIDLSAVSLHKILLAVAELSASVSLICLDRICGDDMLPMIGFWLDGTTLCIDTVLVVKDRLAALQLGAEQEQKAIGFVIDGDYQGDITVEGGN